MFCDLESVAPVDAEGKMRCRCRRCGRYTEWKRAAMTCDRRHQICQASEEFQQTPPSEPRRLLNFTIASIKHFVRGNPTCTQAEIDARLALCLRCKYYDEQRRICAHEGCGCNLGKERKYLNKLAWADQACPVARWVRRGETAPLLDPRNERSVP